MAPRALNERRDGIQGDATSPNAIAQQGPSQPPGGGPPQSMPTQATSSQTTSASRSPTLIPVSSSSITNPSSRPSSSTSGSSATTVTSTQPTSTNASDSNSNTGFFGGGGGKSTGMIVSFPPTSTANFVVLLLTRISDSYRHYSNPVRIVPCVVYPTTHKKKIQRSQVSSWEISQERMEKLGTISTPNTSEFTRS